MNPQSFLKSLQGYTSQISQPLQNGAQMGMVSAKSLTSALQQAIAAISKIKNATMGLQGRAQKGATPIATLDSGDILLSDGTVQLSPQNEAIEADFTATPQDRAKLNILKNNVLAQTAYTPQVAEAIRKTQFIPYGGGDMSSQKNLSGGFTNGYDNNIYINRHTLNSPGAVDVARHELLHNFDNRAYGLTGNRGFGDSNGFGKDLKREDSERYNHITQSKLVKNPALYKNNDRTRDIETYAYYGQPGQRILNDNQKIADRYRNVYVPASKNINASPVYPSGDYLRYFYETSLKKKGKKK